MTHTIHYPLPGKDSLGRWRERLLQCLPFEVDAPQRYRAHYYDSFDWRLAGAGKVLEWQEGGADAYLRLYQQGDSDSTISLRFNAEPSRFVTELPDGPLKQELARLLDVRALLPIATIETRSTCFRLADAEGKTRARLYLEAHSLIQANTKRAKLGKALRLVPLHGYKKAAKQLIAHLERDLKLRADDQDLLGQALAKLGAQRGDYSSRLDIPLEPTMRADAALRRILLALLDAMEINETGLLNDLDSEFLHDFRVAVRRTRSALGQVKTVFPQHTVGRFRAEFAWLGTITSPTRDLDVYLLEFGHFQHMLPQPLRSDLQPLKAFLEDHRKQEFATLCRELRGAHYRKLKKQWRRYLMSPLPGRPTAPDARKAISEVARKRTWRMYRRVLREGNAIHADSPAPELHELRKSCKKLRYLMEFFQALYPPTAIQALIKELKVLQENLGDFQDLEIQRQTLTRFCGLMEQEGRFTPQSRIAMETLLDKLLKRTNKVRDKFHSRFQRFSSKRNRRHFQSLFKPAEK